LETRITETLPTWVEVDLDAFHDNVHLIRTKLAKGVRVLLVTKADAYGHGAVHLAPVVQDAVDYFGVATVDEAVELAALGLRRRLLVMTPILTEEVATVVEKGFGVTVAAASVAKALSQAASRRSIRVEVHVEVDTGMGRTGVLPGELPDLLDEITKLPGVQLGGVFTHFPDAESDLEFTRRQVNDFRATVDRARKQGIEIPVLHCANSAAIASLPESQLDMVRPGLMAYGYRPASPNDPWTVRPIARWKCRIAQLRHIPSGASVSYGRTFRAGRPTTMAVLPVGYGHGYSIRLSNCGEVIVGGSRVPIIGRVTMDMTMVDVTDVSPQPRPGDEVVLLGEAGGSAVTVADLARWAGTIPHEVLTAIKRRVPRLYIRDGKVEAVRSILGVSRDDEGV
jgi:alanine racemase